MSFERYMEVLSDLKRILLVDLQDGNLSEFEIGRIAEDMQEIKEILDEELEFYE